MLQAGGKGLLALCLLSLLTAVASAQPAASKPEITSLLGVKYFAQNDDKGEIAKAQELGKKYYYHGYVYDVPSQFDYKLNFNNLEAMDWKTGQWRPQDRLSAPRFIDTLDERMTNDSSYGTQP